LPIPILPPVIRATLPFKLISMTVPPALFLDGGAFDSEQFVEASLEAAVHRSVAQG